MTNIPLLPILYAGLAGTALALVVATAQNRWSCRVFFLLALRLAIGWHFLFEGLHKVHSVYEGPSDSVRVFTSEPYFKVAPGPLGPVMRKQFDDPAATIAAKVKAAKDITPEAFAKLTAEQQAAECPPAVAEPLAALEEKTQEAIKAEAEADLKAADAAEQKGLKDIAAAEEKETKAAKSDDDKAKAKTKADADRAKLKDSVEEARRDAKTRAESYKEAAPKLITAAKAKYARWVYGVDGRTTKVKGVTGDVSLTAPQRLSHLDRLRAMVTADNADLAAGLGNGFGYDQKQAAERRMDLVTAESDLAKDANAFVTELKKELTGKADDEPAPTTMGKRMDTFTMWFLVAVGGCLMAGLLTRVMCVLGAGFLVMTYLTHPPFPWYPLPPGTEGNPLFINKNVIEALALLALATFPTGRWLGLDALLGWVCGCGRGPAEPTA